MITRLRLAGMTSVHAVRALHTALTTVEGITRLDVARGTVTVEHDGRATADSLRAAAGRKSVRPWLQTRKRVEPGRYSQRTTVFDWNCLKVKPPGSPPSV